MKAVLISIRPQWCEKIASGEKTIEVRKSAPKEVPFKAYIYATKPKRFYKCGAVSTSDELLWLANGKVEMCDGFKFWADSGVYQSLNGRVIGEFICNDVEEFHEWELSPQGKFSDFEEERLEKFLTDACLSVEEVSQYRKNLIYCKPLFGLHITDLKIYDKPRELREFYALCPTKEKGDCLSCDYLADNDYGGTCTNNLTRPPQSWMFVRN
nr:MAG TPA: hypothetical protein [Caudoviricetes sp.]